jgi:hypothetical protein
MSRKPTFHLKYLFRHCLNSATHVEHTTLPPHNPAALSGHVIARVFPLFSGHRNEIRTVKYYLCLVVACKNR